MNKSTNQNVMQRTREPIARRHEGKGSMKLTGTMTKLQNERHENINMKPNPKQTLHKLCFYLHNIIYTQQYNQFNNIPEMGI